MSVPIITKLMNRLTSPYNNDVTSNNYKLMEVAASSLNDTDGLLNDVKEAHVVETADGKSLDYVGQLVDCQRKIGETDDEYRQRILSAVSSYTGGGTPLAIRTAVSQFLGIPIENIVVVDNYTHGGNYGHFTVGFLPEAPFTIAGVIEIVLQAKAAGIEFDGLARLLQENVVVSDTFTRQQDALGLYEDATVDADDVPFGGASNFSPLFIHRIDITEVDSLNIVG